MVESSRVEYKRELTDNLEKEVIAFLNYRDGGIIYIGIEDKTGKIFGVQNPDELQLKIKDRIKNNISPSTMGLFDINLEQQDKKAVIKITVASGSEKPYYLTRKGMSPKGCFIRIGSASEPMGQQMIDELYSKRVRNSIGIIKSRNQSLTFEQLKIYYSSTNLKLTDQFARNLELLTEDGSYNYAAYLLSDTNGLSIKVAKYSGTDRVNLIENEEFGYCSVVKAAKAVLEKLKVENKTFTRITPTTREKRNLLNPVAVREAVINAIVHNNYLNEIPPKFELFVDRFEITSSGGIPSGFTEDEFFMGYSVPQNKELMRVFKDLDMVEQLGSGIPRILECYPKSIYHFTQNFIKVVFPYEEGYVSTTEQAAEQVTEQVTTQAEKLLNYCLIPRTTKEIMNHLNLVHREHFRSNILKPLIDAGKLLLTIPDKPSSPKQKYYTNKNWENKEE